MAEDVAHEVSHVGGNVTAGVVRVGATVRRPRTAASLGVHALLAHLEDAGVEGVPRVLGIDERGREVLTFHPGETIWPNHRHLLGDDEILAAVAVVAREFHRASSTFPIPDDVRWWPGSRDPAGGPFLLHGDFAPWNVVVGDDGVFLIDWDAVAPGRREWELAYLLHTFVPFYGELAPADDEIARRVRVFASEYGIDSDSLQLAIRLVPSRCRQIVSVMRAEAERGTAAFRSMIDEQHDVHWLAAADHVEERLETWLRIARA